MGTQSVWPVNELGEILASSGTGSNNITGFVSQDQIPINPSGKVPLAGIIILDGLDVQWM